MKTPALKYSVLFLNITLCHWHLWLNTTYLTSYIDSFCYELIWEKETAICLCSEVTVSLVTTENLLKKINKI